MVERTKQVHRLAIAAILLPAGKARTYMAAKQALVCRACPLLK